MNWNGLVLPDITGRTKCDKKIHLFVRPYGYPIRACIWAIPDYELIDTRQPITCENCKNFLIRREQHGKNY